MIKEGEIGDVFYCFIGNWNVFIDIFICILFKLKLYIYGIYDDIEK